MVALNTVYVEIHCLSLAWELTQLGIFYHPLNMSFLCEMLAKIL